MSVLVWLVTEDTKLTQMTDTHRIFGSLESAKAAFPGYEWLAERYQANCSWLGRKDGGNAVWIERMEVEA